MLDGWLCRRRMRRRSRRRPAARASERTRRCPLRARRPSGVWARVAWEYFLVKRSVRPEGEKFQEDGGEACGNLAARRTVAAWRRDRIQRRGEKRVRAERPQA